MFVAVAWHPGEVTCGPAVEFVILLSMRFLLKVSRPRFWSYVFGPYLVGVVCGAADRTDLMGVGPAMFALYFLFPANLLIYGVNDIFDYDTDKLNTKKDTYEELVTPDRRKMLTACILALNLPFLIAAIFFAPETLPSTGRFPGSGVIAASVCWIAAMHAYSAIPDIEADKAAGLGTVATFCGPYFTLAICAALYFAAAVISFDYLGFTGLLIGFAYVFLMLASVISYRNGRLFKLYKTFPMINTVAGFVLFWQIAFSKFF